jgi:hypothetical protein
MVNSSPKLAGAFRGNVKRETWAIYSLLLVETMADYGVGWGQGAGGRGKQL